MALIYRILTAILILQFFARLPLPPLCLRVSVYNKEICPWRSCSFYSRFYRQQDNYHCDMLELFNLRKPPSPNRHSPIYGKRAYRFYLSEQIQSLFPPVASGWFALHARVRARVHNTYTRQSVPSRAKRLEHDTETWDRLN